MKLVRENLFEATEEEAVDLTLDIAKRMKETLNISDVVLTNFRYNKTTGKYEGELPSTGELSLDEQEELILMIEENFPLLKDQVQLAYESTIDGFVVYVDSDGVNETLHVDVNEVLKFSDGMEFDTDGPLRKEERSDGWYVMGEGQLIPVKNEKEADKIIAQGGFKNMKY